MPVKLATKLKRYYGLGRYNVGSRWGKAITTKPPTKKSKPVRSGIFRKKSKKKPLLADTLLRESARRTKFKKVAKAQAGAHTRRQVTTLAGVGVGGAVLLRKRRKRAAARRRRKLT